MSLIKLYKKLPLGVKDALKHGYGFIPLKMRLGKQFFKQLESLEKSQWWSEQELESYQNEELNKLIKHAYKNVPYYQKLFKERRLTPDDIKSIKDLPKLPILKKDDIRKNPQEFRAVNFQDKDVLRLSTSGTSGKPLEFYYEKSKEYLNFDPYIWRFFGWAGHKLGQIRATLSCWAIPGQSYTYNPVRNLLILSAYKMNVNQAQTFGEALKKYNVHYIDGYPGMLELLTSCLSDKRIPRPIDLKAIFCHSESLYSWQRGLIEKYWGCKCFDWYGMEERVVLAIECERHKGLHLCPDFGVTEFLESEIPGQMNIIATSLTNYAMPFIRYNTGDIGQPMSQKCDCKRNFPLLELNGGRARNFALAKDGSYIPVANIDIPGVTENIWQFQFQQNIKGTLELHIVKKDGFTDRDLSRVRAKLNEKFGMNVDIDISITDTVKQTANRKTPIFIQNIKEDTKSGIVSEA